MSVNEWIAMIIVYHLQFAWALKGTFQNPKSENIDGKRSSDNHSRCLHAERH